LYGLIKGADALKEKLYIKKIFKIIILFFILVSCQPIEVLDDVIFDYNQLPKISINAKEKLVNEVYEINYTEPYIDDSIKVSPISRLNDWISQNISIFGSENNITINIIDASIKKTERENKEKKKFHEKTEYFYKIHFLIEFHLYNDSNFLLATINVETNRTTTSGKFISLNEKEFILDTLILNALRDISVKSEKLLRTHMSEYLL